MQYRDDRDALRHKAEVLEGELEQANRRLGEARTKLAAQAEKDVDDERQVAELEKEVANLRDKLGLPPGSVRPSGTSHVPWFFKYFPMAVAFGFIFSGIWLHRSAGKFDDEVRALGGASSKIESGAIVGLEGTLAAPDTQLSPFERKPCVAAHTELSLVTESSKQDSSGRWQTSWSYESFHHERSGPPALVVKTATGAVAVRLEDWTPSTYAKDAVKKKVEKRPEHMKVDQATMDAAREKYSSFSHFSVTETCLAKDQAVFVTGKLVAADEPDGPLRVAPHPALRRVEVFPGTRQQLIERASAAAGNERTVGWVMLIIGAVILGILGAIWFKFFR